MLFDFATSATGAAGAALAMPMVCARRRRRPCARPLARRCPCTRARARALQALVPQALNMVGCEGVACGRCLARRRARLAGHGHGAECRRHDRGRRAAAHPAACMEQHAAPLRPHGAGCALRTSRGSGPAPICGRGSVCACGAGHNCFGACPASDACAPCARCSLFAAAGCEAPSYTRSRCRPANYALRRLVALRRGAPPPDSPALAWQDFILSDKTDKARLSL